MTATQLISVEEFVALPDEITDHHELVQGELVEVGSATPRHSLIRSRLESLSAAVMAQSGVVSLIEVNVRTGAGTVRRPDLAFYTRSQIQTMDLDAVPIPESPAIAVEILSPSEKMVAVIRKASEYLRAGSKEVWLVDHENREIHVRTAQGERLLTETQTLETPIPPGFSATVADILAL